MDLEKRLSGLAERAQVDEAFRQELQNDPEGVLARETGITAEQLQQQLQLQPLTDEELAPVAGGVSSGDGTDYPCRYCHLKFGNPIGLWFHEEVWCSKKP